MQALASKREGDLQGIRWGLREVLTKSHIDDTIYIFVRGMKQSAG